MSLIRVLIADDQALLRDGIAILLELEKDFKIAGTARNGEEAVFQYKTLQPDVVLMDIRMPELDGIEATKLIRADDPEARILMLTTFAEDDLLFNALQAGASGYLLKDASAEELASAIRSVNDGKAALEPGAAMKLIYRLRDSDSDEEKHKRSVDFTRREKEVLRLLAEGFSNKEIAERLFLAEGTVKNRVSDILMKIGARDRTQAALRARELNLL